MFLSIIISILLQIGYTTNYGYSFPETSSPVVQIHSNAPKRIIGYNNKGDSINTSGRIGNPNPMWQDGYSYYYADGHWYRKQGDSWQIWDSFLGWQIWGFDWYDTKRPYNPTQYYKDKQTPIPDGTLVFLVLVVLYVAYRKRSLTK